MNQALRTPRDFSDSPVLDTKTLAVLRSGLRESTLRAVEPTELDVLPLWGESAPMQALFEMMERVAPTRANVLIVGESGTGKEVIAECLHRQSKQRAMPFVAINCGAIPASLIEAELFGHERGSFTGAIRSHKGVFERAAGGTLLLDEITEMPIEMQVKLLRVLESGRFYRVGGDVEIDATCRVIAATNRDPEQAVREGALRADLHYRLAVFPLHIPPLRERGADVEVLAERFLAELNLAEGKTKRLSAVARRVLAEHAWPGNVRELKNAVQRAYILADDELELSAVVKPMAAAVPPADCISVRIGAPIAEVERELILATLDRCEGNKRHAAKVLGVSLKTLYNRLNEYTAFSRSAAYAATPAPGVRPACIN